MVNAEEFLSHRDRVLTDRLQLGSSTPTANSEFYRDGGGTLFLDHYDQQLVRVTPDGKMAYGYNAGTPSVEHQFRGDFRIRGKDTNNFLFDIKESSGEPVLTVGVFKVTGNLSAVEYKALDGQSMNFTIASRSSSNSFTIGRLRFRGPTEDSVTQRDYAEIETIMTNDDTVASRSAAMRFNTYRNGTEVNTIRAEGFSTILGADRTPEECANLELGDTLSGLLLNRLDNVQRNNIVNPVDGLLIYNIDSEVIQARQGGSWQPVNAKRVIQVTQANFDVLLNPDPLFAYHIDGNIDIGANSIVIPSGGLTISGYGYNVSAITGSAKIFTGATSGPLFIAGQGLTLTGDVFDLTNNGTNTIELNFVNFVNCPTLGTLTGFRQILMRNVAIFGCTDGVTFAGSWNGLKINDMIIRGSSNIFKAGAGLTFSSRVSMELNVDMPAGTAYVCNFAPANFNLDLSFLLSGGFYTRAGVRDSSNTTMFPNITQSSVKSMWRDNSGIGRTIIGGSWTCTAETATTIVTAGTFVKMAGTTVSSGLDHMTAPASNRLLNNTNELIDYSLIGSITVQPTTGNGDVVAIRVRVWRAATSTFENGRTVTGQVLNIAGTNDRVTIAIADRINLDLNDYVELWIANNTDTTGLRMITGSYLQLTRI